MDSHTNTDLDVNALMSQIRETTAAPKTASPPRPAQINGASARNGAASSESPGPQTIAIFQKLSTVAESHEQALIQLQQNAVVQNTHIMVQNQRLADQDERLKEQTRRLDQQEKKTTPVYLGEGRLFIKTAHELPIIVRADDLQIVAALITEGVWDLPLTKIFQRFIKNDMAYLEIGTHIGYFATLAAALVGARGNVHAFEANPKMFEYLEMNMHLNRCTHISKLISQAVSNQTGKTTFHIFNKNSGNSTLSELPHQLLEEWRERPTPVEVRCTRLDDYYANETMQFDFIKIDAEGAEPLIFEGGTNFFQNRIKPETIIAMEFNPPAIQGLKRDPQAFAQSLFDAGFKLWRIVGVDDFQPVTAPDQLDKWCITELLLTRSENLPAK